MKKTLHIFLFAQLLVLLSSCGQASTHNYQGSGNRPAAVSAFLAQIDLEAILYCEPPFAQFVLPFGSQEGSGSIHSIFTEEEIEEEVFTANKKRLENSKYFTSSFCDDGAGTNIYFAAVTQPLYNLISHTFPKRYFILFQVFRL